MYPQWSRSGEPVAERETGNGGGAGIAFSVLPEAPALALPG